MFTATICSSSPIRSLKDLFSTGDSAYRYLNLVLQAYPQQTEFHRREFFEITTEDQEKITVSFTHTIIRLSATELRQLHLTEDTKFSKNQANNTVAKFPSFRLIHQNNEIINTGEIRNLDVIIYKDSETPCFNDEVEQDPTKDLPALSSHEIVTTPIKHKSPYKKTVIDKKPGIPLSTYIKNNLANASFEKKISIVKAFFSALANLHKNNLVHRNLTIHNVKYDELTQKIHIEVDKNLRKFNDKDYKWQGDIRYAALEIKDEGSATPKLDIWSATIIAAEVLGLTITTEILHTLIVQAGPEDEAKERVRETLNRVLRDNKNIVPKALKNIIIDFLVSGFTEFSSAQNALDYLEQNYHQQSKEYNEIKNLDVICKKYQSQLHEIIHKELNGLSHKKRNVFYLNKNKLDFDAINTALNNNTDNLNTKTQLAVSQFNSIVELRQKLNDTKELNLSKRIQNFNNLYLQKKVTLQKHHDDTFAARFNKAISVLLKFLKIDSTKFLIPSIGEKFSENINFAIAPVLAR